MGRKIRSILLLVLLMVLIYYQQSPLSYAQNIEYDEEGEDTEEKDEEEDPEEEKITQFLLSYPEADGKNGYYVTVPKVCLRHVSETGTTVYQLCRNDEVVQEGRLETTDEEVCFDEAQLTDGKNVLTVYMEDKDGIRIPEYDVEHEFWLDLTAPQFHMEAENGFDVWYQKEAWIRAEGNDGVWGSGMDTISCYCGNEIVGTKKGETGEFLIQQDSQKGEGINVTITVMDRAGNRSEQTKKLYIDSYAPGTSIECVTDYMITSQPVDVHYQITEENKIKEKAADAEWENTEGKKQILAIEEWEENQVGYSAACRYTEDGIYKINVQAADMAGHTALSEAQFIIDSHNPVIRYMDKINGQFMKKFSWNYSGEMFIEDFTTYIYQIQLDGEIYPTGKEITEEGKHLLYVEAVDAAGNKAEAKASFVIDRTPPEIIFIDVEEEEKYEEEKKFQISTRDKDDTIQEIRINGERQHLGENQKIYEYTVQEHKNYEVMVKATDQAGNQSVSHITFEVIPRKNVIQKAVEPIKVFVLNGKDAKGNYDQEGEDDKSIFAGLVLTGLLTGAGVIKKKFL